MLNARRIVVRAPNWVGDLVMATPALRALRAAHPQARIALQLRPELAALVRGAPWFDDLLPLACFGRGAPAVLREGARLRPQRFDLGLCLPDSFASALILRLGGVRRIVGYRTHGRGLLLHVSVDPPPRWQGRRLVARERQVLDLLAAIGCPARGSELELFVVGEEAARAGELLAARGVRPEAPLALLAPGASYGSSKLWPAESFAEVGDALAGRGLSVALVGSPAEAPLTARVASAMRAPVADLARELDLGTLKAVVRGARLLVTNDAGTRHVATAFGVPSVVLLGPTSLAKTNWNLAGVRVLHAEVGCRPCYHRRCPVDHRCMANLEPRRVIEAALAAVGESPARAARPFAKRPAGRSA